jgi:hypothetical protein
MGDRIYKYKIKTDKTDETNIQKFLYANKNKIQKIINKASNIKVGGVFDTELNKIIILAAGNETELYFPFEIIWTKYLWQTHQFLVPHQLQTPGSPLGLLGRIFLPMLVLIK